MRKVVTIQLVILILAILFFGQNAFGLPDSNNDCSNAYSRSFGSYYSEELNSDDDYDDYFGYSTSTKGTVRLEVINQFPSSVNLSYVVFQGGCTGGEMIAQGTISAGDGDFSRNISAGMCPLSPIYVVFSYVGSSSGDHDYSFRVSFTSNGEDCSVNEPPTITMTAPTSNVNVVPGDFVYFVWDGNDADDQALVGIALDNDQDWGNGIYEWLFINQPEDGSMNWEVPDIPEGTYYFVALIADEEFEDHDYASGALIVGSSGGGGTTIPGATISTNVIWNIDNSPYIVTGKVYIQSGVSLIIESGVYVDFSNSTNELGMFVVTGTLTANNVIFDGDQVGYANTWAVIEMQAGGSLYLTDCTLNGRWTPPSSSGKDWRGVHVTGNNTNTINIDNCSFSGFGNAITSSRNDHLDIISCKFDNCATGIGIQYGTVDISGCTFDNFTYNGITLSGGPQFTGAQATIIDCKFTNSPNACGLRGSNDANATISSSCFSNMSNAINNGSSNQFIAENNWWNSETGPTHPDNPDGTGETIVGNVNYEPWIIDGCGGTATSGDNNIFYNIWLVNENGEKTPANGRIALLDQHLLTLNTIEGWNLFWNLNLDNTPSFNEYIYNSLYYPFPNKVVVNEFGVLNGTANFNSNDILGDLSDLFGQRDLKNDDVYYVVFRFLDPDGGNPNICWWTLNYSQFKEDNNISHVQDIFIYTDRPAWTERFYQGGNIKEGDYEDGYVEGYNEYEVAWVTHPIQDEQDIEKPILFVHGIESKDNAFGDLPNIVQMGYSDRDVWQFNYDGKDAMENVSFLLNDAIEFILDKYDNQSQLNIVAHSYGNLVCRRYIQNQGINNKIDRLLMLTPPNHGSQSTVPVNLSNLFCDPFEYIFSKIKDRDFNAPIYYELDPASTSIMDLLNEESQNQSTFNGSIPIVLAGTENMEIIVCHEEAYQHQDGVVSISSASMINQCVPLYLMDIYHTEFSDKKYDEIILNDHFNAFRKLISDFFNKNNYSTSVINQRIVSNHENGQIYEPIEFVFDPTDITLENDNVEWTEADLPFQVNKIDTWNSDEIELDRGGVYFSIPFEYNEETLYYLEEDRLGFSHIIRLSQNIDSEYYYAFSSSLNSGLTIKTGLAMKLKNQNQYTDIPVLGGVKLLIIPTFPPVFIPYCPLVGSVHALPMQTTNSPFIDLRESDALIFSLACPVDLTIVSPSGDTVRNIQNQIGGAYYFSFVDSITEDTCDQVIITYPEEGVYSAFVTPEEGSEIVDTYSLVMISNTDTVLLSINQQISNIPIEGFKISTLDTGSIHGVISANSNGLLGVPVDLYNSNGNVIASIVSDETGYYQFAALDNGLYSVSIATPLGYQTDEETKEIQVQGLPHQVNFELTELDITPQQRSRGYWSHQLHRALKDKPKDHTIEDFANLAGLINKHFNNNQINPVDFYSVPQPASQEDSLNVLKRLLHMRRTCDGDPFLKRLANAQLMALMLNVVSGKVSQTHEISIDGRTVSQAITYCDMLINDEIDPPVGGPGYGSKWCQYIRASFILIKANLGLTVPADMIPEDVLEIYYKLHYVENLPDGFELKQNAPNPFNPTTEISLALPVASNVNLTIFNIMGQKVATLFDGQLEAGNHSFKWNGKNSASGIYFYRMQADNYSATRKMLLLK